jgi:hypothetical protein
MLSAENARGMMTPVVKLGYTLFGEDGWDEIPKIHLSCS